MSHEKIEMIGIDIKGLIKRQKHDGFKLKTKYMNEAL